MSMPDTNNIAVPLLQDKPCATCTNTAQWQISIAGQQWQPICYDCLSKVVAQYREMNEAKSTNNLPTMPWKYRK